MQAMSLDSQRAAAETNTPTNEDRLARTLKTKINGSWIEVMVDASCLRQELGMPLHDLFGSGACHRYAHSETVGLMLKTVIIDHPQCYN